jgi:hypothetical protein
MSFDLAFNPHFLLAHKVSVHNLPYDATPQDLALCMAQFGHVLYVSMHA